MPVWQRFVNSRIKNSFSWILIPTSHKWSRNWMEFKVRRSNIWRCHIRPVLKRNCINCGLPKLRLVIYLWAAALDLCLPPPLHNFDSMFVSLRPFSPVTDLQFSQTLLGRPVPFATAGDCYSAAKCPQVGGTSPMAETQILSSLASAHSCCHVFQVKAATFVKEPQNT